MLGVVYPEESGFWPAWLAGLAVLCVIADMRVGMVRRDSCVRQFDRWGKRIAASVKGVKCWA